MIKQHEGNLTELQVEIDREMKYLGFQKTEEGYGKIIKGLVVTSNMTIPLDLSKYRIEISYTELDEGVLGYYEKDLPKAVSEDARTCRTYIREVVNAIFEDTDLILSEYMLEKLKPSFETYHKDFAGLDSKGIKRQMKKEHRDDAARQLASNNYITAILGYEGDFTPLGIFNTMFFNGKGITRNKDMVISMLSEEIDKFVEMGKLTKTQLGYYYIKPGMIDPNSLEEIRETHRELFNIKIA